MSWDCYVKTLMAHKLIEEVAIWGKKPGEESQWAASPGLSNISVEEIKRLAGDTNILRCCGPTVGGLKCMFLQDNSDDPNVLSMNLKSVKDEQGNTHSVCVGVCKSAFIIVKGTPESTGGSLAEALFSTVKHLNSCGC